MKWLFYFRALVSQPSFYRPFALDEKPQEGYRLDLASLVTSGGRVTKRVLINENLDRLDGDHLLVRATVTNGLETVPFS
jgi:hypothetical protein